MANLEQIAKEMNDYFEEVGLNYGDYKPFECVVGKKAVVIKYNNHQFIVIFEEEMLDDSFRSVQLIVDLIAVTKKTFAK